MSADPAIVIGRFGRHFFFGEKDEEIFLGREIAQHRDFSEETAREIDAEVRRLISDAHNNARRILTDNIDTLHKMADALLERETLESNEIDMIVNGEELPEKETDPPPSEETMDAETEAEEPDAVEADEDEDQGQDAMPNGQNGEGEPPDSSDLEEESEKV